MWELDYKEGWAPENWGLQTMVLEKTVESPLDSKEIKPINPKGNQFWIFIVKTNVEAEAPIIGNLMQRANSLEKTLMLGKIEGNPWKDDEMVGWHPWLNRHESEETPGASEGQWSLVCCSPWDHKESDITKWLKNNKDQLNLQKGTSFVNVTAITTKTGKKLSEPFFFQNYEN